VLDRAGINSSRQWRGVRRKGPEGEGKVCRTPRGAVRVLISLQLASRWINHCSLWRMASATPDLRLPSQPSDHRPLTDTSLYCLTKPCLGKQVARCCQMLLKTGIVEPEKPLPNPYTTTPHICLFRAHGQPTVTGVLVSVDHSRGTVYLWHCVQVTSRRRLSEDAWRHFCLTFLTIISYVHSYRNIDSYVTILPSVPT